MQTANDIYRSIAQIEAMIADPVASKGRLTALKAAHRKLARQYFKMIAQVAA